MIIGLNATVDMKGTAKMLRNGFESNEEFLQRVFEVGPALFCCRL